MAKSTIRTLFDITYREDIENVIRELNPHEYAYIYHDKDILLDGTLKKPHYHIWCRWTDPVRNDSMAKILNRTNHLCITAKNQKACIRYMTHETTDAVKMGKHKYDRTEIHTNLEQDELQRIFMITEIVPDKIMSILDLLKAYHDNRDNDYARFIYDLITLGYLEIYQKYYNSVFSKLIKETFKV